MSFWKKAPAEKKPVEFLSAFKGKDPKDGSERPYFAEGEAAIEASKAAAAVYKEAALKAYESYKPTGAVFKIVQSPAGHFEILRRHVMRARGVDSLRRSVGDDYHRWADEIEAMSTAPVEYYETVKNDKAPIVTKTYGGLSSYGYGSDRERLTGYAPLAFNCFEDAEAYLFRMAQPAEHTTEYDFPPLKKRPVKRAKKAAA